MRFGGGASAAQLAWLRGTLRSAAQRAQRAVVCCHLPLFPGTCPGACLLWNYEEVLDICWGAGNVVATFAGHAHEVSAHNLLPDSLAASCCQRPCWQSQLSWDVHVSAWQHGACNARRRFSHGVLMLESHSLNPI